MGCKQVENESGFGLLLELKSSQAMPTGLKLRPNSALTMGRAKSDPDVVVSGRTPPWANRTKKGPDQAPLHLNPTYFTLYYYNIIIPFYIKYYFFIIIFLTYHIVFIIKLQYHHHLLHEIIF